MPFAPTTPVTGAAITGLTSPTYTIAADMAPDINGKQYAVTALGGTQANVEVNSVSKPFTVTFFRPKVPKVLGSPNPITGLYKAFPVNSYKFITRKGVNCAANQGSVTARITTIIDVPAGADTFEPEDLRAMMSLHVGALSQQADGICTTILTGVV